MTAAGSGRIPAALARGRQDGRPLVIPYLTAGYPEAGETPGLVQAVVEAGADMVEIGLPFSDPLADGPTIQAASQRALAAGMTHRKALEAVRETRRRLEVPLILMGYYNPMLRFGLSAFFGAAREAGADGVIVPDLPLEESGAAVEAARGSGLSLVFLVAPTTPGERISELDDGSTDFTYCVSLTGVTGARAELSRELPAYLARVSERTRKPFVIGFGISRPEQVGAVAPPAAGVVIGSALLKAIEAGPDPAARRVAAGDFVRRFTGRKVGEVGT